MRSFAALIVMMAMLFATGCSNPKGDERMPTPATSYERVSDNLVEHGARIAKVMGCVGCHGEGLDGRDWSDELGVLWTANLTRSAQENSDQELAQIIATGRRPDRELIGMPSHLFTQLADTDMAAILAFVRSMPAKGAVHPAPTFSPELRTMLAEGKIRTSAKEVAKLGKQSPPDLGRDHALGRYIARSTCAECHGMDLRGGEPLLPKDPARPDLRIVAAYSQADFRTLMRTGKAAGNRELGLMGEVARGRFANLTDREIAALQAYLTELGTSDP